MMRIVLLLCACVTVATGQAISGTCVQTADISNCNTCWNPSIECVTCADRWWYKPSDRTCIRCSNQCEVCKDDNGDDITECSDCDDNYYLASGECEPCEGHCKDCSEKWKCNSCDEGYRNEDTDPISCFDCDIGCSTCLDGASNRCFECERGYYYSRNNDRYGFCNGCGSRCLECTSGTTCNRCQTGYTWTGSACSACITFCDPDFCLTNGACTQCISGYSLVDGQCRSCANCASCPLTGGCTTTGDAACLPGYILNDDFTCHRCPNVDDNSICTRCDNGDRGRYNSADNTCLYCPENCLACSEIADVLTCTSNSCLDGFYIVSGQCVQCDGSCQRCNGGNNDDCTSCNTGFGRISNTCQACATGTGTPNCATCSGTTCSTCLPNFYKSPTTTPDANECISCGRADNENVGTCVTCASASRGRFLSTVKCVGCDTYGNNANGACLACSSTACTTCADSSYVAGNGDCDRCSAPNDCKHCTSDAVGACSECYSGFWNNNGVCTACRASCDVCTDSFTCTDCSDTFYVGTICTGCAVTDCADCVSDVNTCAACISTHHRTSSILCTVMAVTNCAETTVDAATCSRCDDGRQLNANACTTSCTVTGCDRCDTAVAAVAASATTIGSALVAVLGLKCEECSASTIRIVVDPNCIVCGPNCLACALTGDRTTCTTCEDGYFLQASDSMCVACQQGTTAFCGNCVTDATTCTSCFSSGYYYSSNTCTACTDATNCADCSTIGEGTCDVCNAGMVLSGGTCAGRSNSIRTTDART